MLLLLNYAGKKSKLETSYNYSDLLFLGFTIMFQVHHSS